MVLKLSLYLLKLFVIYFIQILGVIEQAPVFIAFCAKTVNRNTYIYIYIYIYIYVYIYIGETARSVHESIYEHKRDIRLGNLNKVHFLHISKTDNNIEFNAATILAHIHNDKLRQIF